MIFAILGTQKFQLNRLLRLLDEYAGTGTICDEIIAQTGASDYKPQNFSCHAFLGKDEFETYVEKSDVVISHGGVGAIMTAFQKEKPVIIFPRLAKYHEHVDDHQVEIARMFDEKGYALFCGESDDLPKLIEKSKTHSFNRYISQKANIVKLIEDYFTGMYGNTAPGKKR